MTLRQKTMLVIGIAIFLLSVVLFFSARTILLGGVAHVETRGAEVNLSRALNAVRAETVSLTSAAEEWSVSEETALFAAGLNQEFIRKNMTPAAFLSQQLDLAVFFSPTREMVYGVRFDPASRTLAPLPEAVRDRLLSESSLFAGGAAPVQGLLDMQDTPLLVAASPIIGAERDPAVRGVLILGRYVNARLLDKLAENSRLSMRILFAGDAGLPADFARATQNLTPDRPAWIAPLDENTIAAYAMLASLGGPPGFILRIDEPRDIFLQGRKTVQYFSFLLIALGLLFAIANLFLLEKTVLSRLSSLSRQVSSVAETTSPSSRVTVSGHDELSRLADSINGMLRSLESAQDELRESEAATRALLEGLPDLLLRLDRQGTVLDFKTSHARLVATPPKLLVGNTIADAFPAAFAEKIAAALEEAFTSRSPRLFEQELVVNNRTQNQEVRITPLNEREAIAILRDFTERRQLERSLQFFSFRDSQTGLFNRAYWEDKLAAAASQSDAAAGIILCEIDELRWIRDSLGQEHANSLLAAAAAALRASLPLDCVIARIGMERFGVLLLDTSEAELKRTERKIRQEAERSGETEVQLHFSLSLGSAVGIPLEVGIQELLKTAQSRLHKETLTHSKASRDKLFRSLQAALETRDFVTHQHAARLWALGRSLAKTAGLPDRRLRDFKLLTQFHDIGKVGLPDEMIFKQGPLTFDEMKQMKMHVEIGHRIAQSIPELSSIADLLLKHHEWWDGRGYPLGLRGEEIPLECRIFSIVDAFDAMTNDRPGRKAFTAKEAAAELRKCAGSQFDPDLVKRFLQLLGEEP